MSDMTTPGRERPTACSNIPRAGALDEPRGIRACQSSHAGAANPPVAAVRFERWDRAGTLRRTDPPCGSTAPAWLLSPTHVAGAGVDRVLRCLEIHAVERPVPLYGFD